MNGLAGLRRSALLATFFILAVVGLIGSWESRADEAATVTLLQTFAPVQGEHPIGANPGGRVSVANDGTLYGTTVYGGPYGGGVVYKISPDGNYSVLHSFGANGDVYRRPNSVILASDGNLYGLTDLPTSGPGFFRVTPGGQFTLLSTLPARASLSPLLEAQDGDLYGTSAGNDFGIIFKLTKSGAFTQVYQFNRFDGAFPTGGLIQGPDGAFYGSTTAGGASAGNPDVNFGLGLGTVFKLEAETGTLTVLYSFFGLDGREPRGPPTLGGDGYLYGVTLNGGVLGWGTLYKLSTLGEFTQVHEFEPYNERIAYPNNRLIWTRNGKLYGTTFSGGSDSSGILFKIGTDGTGVELVSDLGRESVSHPGPLTLGPDNLFYGTGGDAGPGGYGTIYSVLDPELPGTVADLSLTGGASQTSAGLVSANLVVTNATISAATSIQLSVQLPVGASLIANSSSAGCSQVVRTVTCAINSISGRASALRQIVAQLSAPQPSLSLSFTVSSADQTDPVSSNNTLVLTTVPTSANVDLSISGSGTQDARGLATASLLLVNSGAGMATSVRVTFNIPPNARLQSSASSPGCVQSGQTVTCLIGGLAGGDSTTLQIAVKLPAAQGSFALSLTASSDQNETAPANNSAVVDASYVYYDYTYDGNGRLSHRSVNSGPRTHVFYTKGGLLLGEYGVDGTAKRENIYFGESLVAYENTGVPSSPTCAGTRTYVVTDPLHSTVAATDECGAVAWQQEYLPFGLRVNDVALNQNDQWFAGDFQEQRTDLVNMGARQYSPHLGRFLSIDPAEVDARNPLSFNRYAYANNNPYRYVDPNGETPLEVGFLIMSTAELFTAISSGQPIGLAALNVAIDIVGVVSPIPGISGASHAIQAASKVANLVEVARTAEKIGEAAKGISAFSKAAQFGIKPYRELMKLKKGMSLEAHHLIEKRFAAVLGVKEGDMAAIALTKAEHQVFTNAWRQAIGYGAGTANATKQQVMDVAKQIYKDYPDILHALGLK